MKHRKWDNKQKFEIVLEGLKSGNVGELCNRHQISQGMYYVWRDQFLSNGTKVFEKGIQDKDLERIKAENNKLKLIVGELTAELKKTIGKKTSPSEKGNSGRRRNITCNKTDKSRASVLGL